MSFQRKWISAFLADLPQLKSSGVIDASSETKLREHYQALLAERKESHEKVFQVSLAILGAVLIGGGIILLFNYNWDMLPKAVRIVVSALPLLGGAVVSFYTLYQEKSAVWREVSAIWTAVGGAVLVALLSQIYQIHGSLFNYFVLVLATTFPLIYLFDSKGLAILYQFFLFGLFPDHYWSPRLSVLGAQLLLSLAYCPWLITKLHRGSPPVRVLARYLVIAMVIFQSIALGGSNCVELNEFYCVLLGCSFALLAMRLAEQGERGFRNPWGAVSYLLILVVLTVANCVHDRLGLIFWNIHHEWNAAVYLGVVYYLLWLITLGTLGCWQFYASWRSKTLHAEKVVLGAIVLGVFLEGVFDLESIYLYMLALVAWGVAKLWRGIRQQRIALFNSGLVIIVVFMICRFLSSDFGLLVRSAGFIITGVFFLVANMLFTRKCRRRSEGSVSEVKEVEQ